MPAVEQNRLAIALNIEPGEGGRLVLLRTQSFVIGIALVSFYAASSTLFLSAYGSDKLPHICIAAAIVSSLFGLSYARFTKRNSPSSILIDTTEDVWLLGLDREALYKLMADHPEVLRKIIHELCERLRYKR